MCGWRDPREEARFVGLAKATPSFPESSKEVFSLLMEPHIFLWRLNISKIHLSRVVAIFFSFLFAHGVVLFQQTEFATIMQ